MRPGEGDLLVCILVIIGGIGFFAYKDLTTPPRPANSIAGRPFIIDGDTVVISGTHIRLDGIDAPESAQTCTDAAGKIWPCGQAATRALRGYIGGREIVCAAKALDRYHRQIAVCRLPDGSDINAWMVRQGFAVAYGFAKTYRAEEDEARSAKRGIWAGTFTEPAEWRKLNPRHEAD